MVNDQKIIRKFSRYVRVAPRKLRAIVPMLRNIRLEEGINQLDVQTNPTSHPIRGVLRQVLSEAKERAMNPQTAIIHTLIVDEGPSLKRRRFRSRGRATPITKKRSHITIIVREKDASKALSAGRNMSGKKHIRNMPHEVHHIQNISHKDRHGTKS